MTGLLLSVAAWSTSGVLIAWVLRRGGHNFPIFAGLGIAYGPLVVIFFLESIQNQRKVVELVRDDHQPSNPDGWMDIVVGIDGTDASTASALEAIRVLGPSIRRIRLAGVVDFETGFNPERHTTDDELRLALTNAADRIDLPHPEIILLSGRPDEVLVEHAVDEEFDLLVVAHRHSRFEAGLVGSTVARLARNADLPLLIGPPVDTSTEESNADNNLAELGG